jgi:integrin beta 1
VKVTECLSTPDQQFKEISIYPDSLKNDKLVIEIETLCDCDCDTNENTWEVNSNICTAGNGTLKCGVCDCDKGRTGKFCECSSTDIGSSTSGCIKQGDNSTVKCSGLGKCECGVCICNAGYSGPNCECYDLGCRDNFNEDCGGGSRGHCVCGQCVCEPGYTGSKCDCTTSNDSCIYDNKVCNNFGTCKCGECTCVKEYIGDHCQTCFLCGDTVCDDVIDRRCAQCAFNGTTNQDASCSQGCPAIQLVSTIEKKDESVVCSIKQPNGCLLAFQIKKTEASYTILVQKTAICAEPVNIVPIAAGVVGGVVAIGLLLLLLWKILTTVFDRIEYSKFEEDLKQCKWAQQDNPFYKGATTTYKNPMLDTSEAPKDK